MVRILARPLAARSWVSEGSTSAVTFEELEFQVHLKYI